MCNFNIFGLLSYNFHQNVGILFTIWEVYAHIWIGKGPIFGPKIELGKSLGACDAS